jgi:hypothetical protein
LFNQNKNFMKPIKSLEEGALLKIEELEDRIAPDGVTINICNASGVVAVAGASNGNDHGDVSVSVSGQGAAVAAISGSGAVAVAASGAGEPPIVIFDPNDPPFQPPFVFHWHGHGFSFQFGDE